MTIAVDFDGTIVEHRYPEIGREIPFAIETLKRLQDHHHYKLILWTAREGKLLDDAVNYCKERGLVFYAINQDSPDELVREKHEARKLKVDMFIDDRNLGGLPDWGVIYKMITRRLSYEQIYSEEYQNLYDQDEKKGFFSRLFGK